jgi:hypothetical protein
MNEGDLTPLSKAPDMDNSSGTMPNMSSVFALGYAGGSFPCSPDTALTLWFVVGTALSITHVVMNFNEKQVLFCM